MSANYDTLYTRKLLHYLLIKEMILLKIERLNENQIRCTLNKADLADKELKLSELAYGSPKAKELFREMMQQASNELGFEAEDVPLMIEAVPVSPECLILLVTKVEDPEELDTRFSRFSNVGTYDIDDDLDDDDEDEYENPEINIDEAEEIHSANVSIEMNGAPDNIFEAIEGLVNHLTGMAAGQPNIGNSAASDKASDTIKNTTQDKCGNIFRIYSFDDLSTVIKASKLVAGIYLSSNTLYKDPVSGTFYLLLNRTENTAAEFSRTCNILNEYGNKLKTNYAMPYHFAEHFKVIVADEAIQTLSAL